MDTIGSYEQADSYIRTHIKNYYADSRPSTKKEIFNMSKELKDKYNALVPEHNSFLARKAAASQCTKADRSYLQDQHRRKSEQQKKKDVLE